MVSRYKLFNWAWNSPTLMTWGSFLTKALNVLVILPIILSSFSETEVAVWFLFLSVFSLLTLVDLGFTQSFSRVISYAFGGMKTLQVEFQAPKDSSSNKPNWELIAKTMATMRKIYLWLAIGGFFAFCFLGTLSVYQPISNVENNYSLWLAWAVIVISSPFYIYGILFTTFLIGTNKIAQIKRWDILFSVFSIMCSVVIINMGGEIIHLVINNQFWILCVTFRNYLFVKQEVSSFFPDGRNNFGFDKEILNLVWPKAWRSAVGIGMSYGLTQFSGIFYAQGAEPGMIASYLLALRLLTTILEFSKAPFYSKIPQLTILLAQNKVETQIKTAKQAMILSYWVYTLACLSLVVVSDFLLDLINSDTEFVSPQLWLLLSVGYFIERYGAMHIQLYSTTNNIIWHKANGYSGVIYIAILLLLYNNFGVYTFPIATIVSNVLFYAWYSAYHSYKKFRLNFWAFERKVAIPPFVILLSSVILSFVL